MRSQQKACFHDTTTVSIHFSTKCLESENICALGSSCAFVQLRKGKSCPLQTIMNSKKLFFFKKSWSTSGVAISLVYSIAVFAAPGVAISLVYSIAVFSAPGVAISLVYLLAVFSAPVVAISLVYLIAVFSERGSV